MPRGRIAAHKAQAIGRDKLAFLNTYSRAFGITHLRTHSKSRLFTAPCQIDGTVDRKQPRVIKVKVSKALFARGQKRRFRQTGTRVRGCKTGNIQRSSDRLAQSGRRKIRSTGVSFLLPKINRNANPFITTIFNGLDIVTTHRNGLTEAL